MTTSEKLSGTQLQHLANATRWLFWVLLVYVVWWLIRDIFVSAFYPMNPHARASIWGMFRWYFPSLFVLICLVVPLIFLFFIQSSLHKGVTHADDKAVEKGLGNLSKLLKTLALLFSTKLLFELLVEPNWWSWEF